MFNSISSCIMNETVPVHLWDTVTMNKILKNGDWMCQNACLGDTYQNVSDLSNKTFWLMENLLNCILVTLGLDHCLTMMLMDQFK